MGQQLQLFGDGADEADRLVDQMVASMDELGLSQDEREGVLMRLIFRQTMTLLAPLEKRQKLLFLALLMEECKGD